MTDGPQPKMDAARRPTARGRRTREQLLNAARSVFERDGYLAARVADIAGEAGVAHGTFYTYFTSKEEVYREVVGELIEEMYRPHVPVDGARVDPVTRIDRANRNFIRFYKANARMMAIMEQVATFNDEFREQRRGVRDRAVARAAQGIRELQQSGLADPGLDPQLTASALVSMVNNFAYAWLVLGESFEEEAAIAHLTLLWCRGLGLEVTAALDTSACHS